MAPPEYVISDPEQQVISDDRLYSAYLRAFSVVRSGGVMTFEPIDNAEIEVAIAVGSQDGAADDLVPLDRCELLKLVRDMIENQLDEEKCAVVPFNSTEETRS